MPATPLWLAEGGLRGLFREKGLVVGAVGPPFPRLSVGSRFGRPLRSTVAAAFENQRSRHRWQALDLSHAQGEWPVDHPADHELMAGRIGGGYYCWNRRGQFLRRATSASCRYLRWDCHPYCLNKMPTPSHYFA